MNSATEYKIRHKQTGLYQESGFLCKWSKKGKTWKNKAGLSNHVREVLTNRYQIKLDPENWEIESVLVVRSSLGSEDFNVVYKGKLS